MMLARPLLLLVAALIILGSGYFLFTHFANPAIPANVSISGVVHLNGPIPSDGSISMSIKPVAPNATYQPFATNLPATDEAPWSYNQASKNGDYEVQAYLMQGGKTIATSNPLQVSAPAKDEELTINYVPPAPATPPVANATLSGTVTINGYIPPAATLQVMGRKSGTLAPFVQVGATLTAQASQGITYSTAIPGQLYDVQAVLTTSGGLNIGQSSVVTLSAPTNNAVLQINSTAQSPYTPASPAPTNSGISGTFNLNGAAPIGSSIVILARPTGTSTFNVVMNGIQPVDEGPWSWNGGTYGQSYDMQAVLKNPQSNGTQTDVADSNIITAVVPAGNQVFTLNSNYIGPGPSGPITLTCGTHNSGPNNWTASISFGSVTGAQSYWYQVGSTNGGSDLVNTQLNATNNPTQTINATLNDSVTYYARYATAPTQNAAWSQFSSFSNTTSFSCPN